MVRAEILKDSNFRTICRALFRYEWKVGEQTLREVTKSKDVAAQVRICKQKNDLELIRKLNFTFAYGWFLNSMVELDRYSHKH